MNKKVMIIASIVFICLLIIGLSIFRVAFRKSIPLVNGLTFGASPRKTERLLGGHYEKQVNTGDTGKTAYIYKADVLGSEATISCSFMNDKRLTDVDIRWDNCEDALFQNVYSSLYSYYGKKDHFFVKTEEIEQRGITCVKMGIDTGSTGIFYTITKEGTSVTVNCVYLS